MSALQRRYLGPVEGDGILTLKGSDGQIPVGYHLKETEKYIDYGLGKEESAGSEFEGEIWTAPDEVQFPSGPHKLMLADGRTVECWATVRRGQFKCELRRSQAAASS